MQERQAIGALNIERQALFILLVFQAQNGRLCAEWGTSPINGGSRRITRRGFDFDDSGFKIGQKSRVVHGEFIGEIYESEPFMLWLWLSYATAMQPRCRQGIVDKDNVISGKMVSLEVVFACALFYRRCDPFFAD